MSQPGTRCASPGCRPVAVIVESCVQWANCTRAPCSQPNCAEFARRGLQKGLTRSSLPVAAHMQRPHLPRQWHGCEAATASSAKIALIGSNSRFASSRHRVGACAQCLRMQSLRKCDAANSVAEFIAPCRRFAGHAAHLHAGRSRATRGRAVSCTWRGAGHVRIGAKALLE